MIAERRLCALLQTDVQITCTIEHITPFTTTCMKKTVQFLRFNNFLKGAIIAMGAVSTEQLFTCKNSIQIIEVITSSNKKIC